MTLLFDIEVQIDGKVDETLNASGVYLPASVDKLVQAAMAKSKNAVVSVVIYSDEPLQEFPEVAKP